MKINYSHSSFLMTTKRIKPQMKQLTFLMKAIRSSARNSLLICLNRLSHLIRKRFRSMRHASASEKKLAIKPCIEDMKDSFRWSSGEGKKRKPKKITCKIFFAKVMDLMGWDPKYRYKILGKLIRTKNDSIFVFDLSSAEAYQNRAGGNPAASRAPLYPEEWKNQFGIPATEHQDIQQISIFDDYTVFKLERSEEGATRKEAKNDDELSNSASDYSGFEETADQNPQ